MAHEPKLSVFKLTISPVNAGVENSNRWLFKNLTNTTNDQDIEDNVLFLDVFTSFINAMDQPEMYRDTISKKSLTANQPNLLDPNVPPNVIPHSGHFIIDGVIEGGTYGRKRTKTSTQNKNEKSEVSERDAITDNFYFLVYLPPASNKSVLMIQSYSDETIDAVVKKFWENFLKVEGVFYKPKVKKFIPPKIIDDFRHDSVISGLEYSSEVPSETLLDPALTEVQRNFRVTVTIEPIEGDLTIDEFESARESVANTMFNTLSLGLFRKKKGVLKDRDTNKTSSFELNSGFEIQPIITLSKYIDVDDEGVFSVAELRRFCHLLLEQEIKPIIYPT